MANIYKAFFSRKQAAVVGSHCVYKLTSGEIAKVTELTKEEKPGGAWDDYTYVGEVDCDDHTSLLQPCADTSMSDMLSNLKKVDPAAYEKHFANIHPDISKLERRIKKSHECDRYVHSIGKCTCGLCEPKRYSVN